MILYDDKNSKAIVRHPPRKGTRDHGRLMFGSKSLELQQGSRRREAAGPPKICVHDERYDLESMWPKSPRPHAIRQLVRRDRQVRWHDRGVSWNTELVHDGLLRP